MGEDEEDEDEDILATEAACSDGKKEGDECELLETKIASLVATIVEHGRRNPSGAAPPPIISSIMQLARTGAEEVAALLGATAEHRRRTTMPGVCKKEGERLECLPAETKTTAGDLEKAEKQPVCA